MLPLNFLRSFVVLIGFASLSHADDVKLLPASITLHGDQALARLTLVNTSGEHLSNAVELESITWDSSAPEVAKVIDGQLQTIANGTATITATTQDGKRGTTSVTVQSAGTPHEWSFRNDVQSVLAKQGCNRGACHGALAGKGGFRLSLRGYDAKADFGSITQEARGRRIEKSDAGRSLILTKPTGALPHKGGLKLVPGSRDYQIMANWIATGATAPSDADPQLERITVLPDHTLLATQDHSQILVQAHYDDGRILDVTHWAQFSTTDEAVASVDPTGWVTVNGSGENAVLVWFGSHVALARMTIPYPHEVPAEVYANAARENFIDEFNLDQLKTLHLKPSPRCDDQTFLRRVSIDCVGRLPTNDLRKSYFEKDEASRRAWLVDRLLSSDDYVDYWSYKLSDVLLINGNRLRPIAVKSYYDWLRSSVAENKPWNLIAEEVLTATGRSEENGATNFYALNQTPEEMTENACQAFMGLSIGCAKCHNHPLEKWTNDQYYAMANLFARVRAKGWGGDHRNGDGKRTLYVSASGELIQPNRGKPQSPAPLDQEPLDFDDPSDRRLAMAQWMTSPENLYFSRAIANRIWANFFGRGLVEQVDDLRLSNPASNEPLLEAAAQRVVEANYDLKQLMRDIMRSETYQRTGVPLDENRDETKYLTRYYSRRLMAEVLLDSIDQTLGTITKFDEVAFPGADMQKTDFYKPGTRSIQLYDSAVNSYFLKTFGRNPREITCECERSSDSSMVQVLHLSNGETLNPKLEDKENVVQKAIAAGSTNASIIETIFIRALSRKPTDAELQNLLGMVKQYGKDRNSALQDVAWSILTSTEFTFNH